jgi:molybdate transport repressor ModE-like protein
VDSWSGIEIRHLAALRAIEREGSFGGAARRLGYVQSAISQQISQLERLVGTRLVERSRGQGGARLTAPGQQLLAHADRVLTQLEVAKLDLATPARAAPAPLRIGAFESVAAQILPEVVARLSASGPQVDLRIVDVAADTSVFAALSDFELDAAFAEVPPEDGPITGVMLLSDPCVLVVARDSPLADRVASLTLAEISALPLVAHPAWRMTPLIDAHFEAAGLRPAYRYRCDNNVAIQSLVSTGACAAIMARLAVNPHDPRIKSIELGALPRRGIGLYWHRDRTSFAALAAFVETVETVCAGRADRVTSTFGDSVREKPETARP